VIVNHNGLKYLEPCLRSVQKLDYPQDRYEVIFVDNASGDGSVEFVRKVFPTVKLIQLERNYGFCLPNNIAAQKASGEYLALLNNDTEVDTQWLKELVKGLSYDPAVKSVASKILYCDQRGRINAAGGKLTAIGHGFYEGYGDKDGPKYNHPKFTGFGCAAGVLVERQFFLDTGGFDPVYYAGIEEHDLGWRIWLFGYRVLYMPSALLYHWESATFGRRAGYHPTKIFLTTRNRLFTLSKNVQNLAKGIVLTLVHDSIQSVVFLKQRRSVEARYIALAYLQWLRRLSALAKERVRVQSLRKVSDKYLGELGVLASFAQLLSEYQRFSLLVSDPHYSEWRAQ
jgi:GT2 family glycosyltransferase